MHKLKKRENFMTWLVLVSKIMINFLLIKEETKHVHGQLDPQT